MALKLLGIEPRPPGPRRGPLPGPRLPTVPVEPLPTEDAALIKIWRPQAVLRAQKGETEFAIARFLHSKGIEGAAARAAAKDIVTNPGDPDGFGASLARFVGIVLLIVGLMVPVLCFALEISGFITIAVLFGCFIGVIAGCKLLWNPADKD
jgi:hypothetical protein